MTREKEPKSDRTGAYEISNKYKVIKSQDKTGAQFLIKKPMQKALTKR
jgi:hypothetical protein